jgi:hypothetical protein
LGFGLISLVVGLTLTPENIAHLLYRMALKIDTANISIQRGATATAR